LFSLLGAVQQPQPAIPVDFDYTDLCT
jgi:hypothetical protein